MATTIQTTDIIREGVAFSFADANDTLWLESGSVIASRSGRAIEGAAGGCRLVVDGTVIAGSSSSSGVYMADGADIRIGATGSILSSVSSGNAVVRLDRLDCTLVNDGRIAAMDSGIAVLSDGGNQVTNRGVIEGGRVGVFLGLFNTSDDRLVNLGDIVIARGSDDAPRGNSAVYAEGDDSRVLNHGRIAVQGETSVGVAIGGSTAGGNGSVVTNHGEIASALGVGVDTSALRTDEEATVRNTGLIGGGRVAIQGGDADETVVNHGEILGDVRLGGGDDVFAGRAGSILDDVFGGGGADVLIGDDGDNALFGGGGADRAAGRGGDDRLVGGGGGDDLRGGRGDDEIAGGRGSDTIRGGAGDDTLSGGWGDDRFVFRRDAGDDVIEGFRQGADRIDISAFGLRRADFNETVNKAISDAGGGDAVLNLDLLGGDGSVLIEGYDADAAVRGDFIF